MSFKFSALSSDTGPMASSNTLAGTGFEITNVEENFCTETEWSMIRDRTSVIFHLGGEIDEIESEFDGRGSKLEPPMPGEMWLVPSGVTYATRVKGSSAKYVELTFDAGSFVEHGQNVSLAPVAGGYDHLLLQTIGETEWLGKMHGDIAEMRLYEIVSAIVQRINTVHSATPEPKTKRTIFFDSNQKAKIESFIQDNLSEPLSLTCLCKLVNETPHRFLWAFRNAFASTPAQFILDQRLRRARRLLQTMSKDITTVAMETGFANHSHLTTAFRTRTGITPSQFRNLA